MRERFNAVFDVILPSLVAIVVALLLGAGMLLLLGANPIEGYAALLQGAFGSTNALADTVVKATPLLLVALGISAGVEDQKRHVQVSGKRHPKHIGPQ